MAWACLCLGMLNRLLRRQLSATSQSRMIQPLPSEIWLEVPTALAGPHHALAYELPSSGRDSENERIPGPCHFLTQMCLVNSSMQALAEPILYSRPTVHPCQLDALTRALATDETIPDLEAVKASEVAKRRDVLWLPRGPGTCKSH